MKRVTNIFLLIMVLLLVLPAGPADAKVYLDIYGKTYKKITVGVPDFKGERADKFRIDMSEVLNKDLDTSGFFIVAPRSLLDRELTNEGIERQEIRFENWRSIGIELVCKGRVLEKDGELVLESYLYDTTDGTMMLAKRYRARPEDWRRMVHRLADDIVLTVTGEKGISSSRVLFVSGDKRRRELYSADLDGQNLTKLTEYRSITLLPSVSPGGRYVAFTSYREGNPNLFVMDLERKREVYAERGEGMKISGAWLNKSTFSYTHTSGRSSVIYVVNVETKEKRVVARSDGINTSPSFSPDGTKMVFVSDMYGSPQVFLKDLSSGETKRLTYFGNYNTAPSFSPKGDLIVYVAKFEGSFEICVMNADGSNQRVLTAGGINDSPQFSPCGRYILYSAKRNGKAGIHLMLFNGDNKRSLRFTEGAEEQPKFMP